MLVSCIEKYRRFEFSCKCLPYWIYCVFLKRCLPKVKIQPPFWLFFSCSYCYVRMNLWAGCLDTVYRDNFHCSHSKIWLPFRLGYCIVCCHYRSRDIAVGVVTGMLIEGAWIWTPAGLRDFFFFAVNLQTVSVSDPVSYWMPAGFISLG
jgi:hypothetical protein